MTLWRSCAIGAILALLAGCTDNTYGAPPSGGRPQNWGQQHYLDNQQYQQQTQDRMNLP
jgi:hypothetical protein